jgi:hypothetical protein
MILTMEKQKEISAHGTEELKGILLDMMERLLIILRCIYHSDISLTMCHSGDAIDAQQFLLLAGRATEVAAKVSPSRAQDEHMRNVWIVPRCTEHAAQLKLSLMTTDNCFADTIESELPDFR